MWWRYPSSVLVINVTGKHAVCTHHHAVPRAAGAVQGCRPLCRQHIGRVAGLVHWLAARPQPCITAAGPPGSWTIAWGTRRAPILLCWASCACKMIHSWSYSRPASCRVTISTFSKGLLTSTLPTIHQVASAGHNSWCAPAPGQFNNSAMWQLRDVRNSSSPCHSSREILFRLPACCCKGVPGIFACSHFPCELSIKSIQDLRSTPAAGPVAEAQPGAGA